MKRRTFLKATAAALTALYPGYVVSASSSADVTFLTRKDAAFNSMRQPFNKRIRLQPEIIAVCKNEAGVQQAVNYARELGLSIAVKSGGHSFEGFSLNDNGMVINVSALKQIQLDNKNQLTCGPGVILAQLYTYCLPRERLVPAGSCGTVGLAGLTLGGGYGLFSREFGLTCDYLTGVRIVTAKGEVIDSDDMPELLWACKGGGNGHFGVVTELRYDTVQAPTTLYQYRLRSYKVSPGKAVSLAKVWFDHTASLPEEAYSAFIYNGKTLTYMLTSTRETPGLLKIISQLEKYMDKNAGLKPDPLMRGVQYYYGQSKPLYFKNISGGYYKNFGDVESFIAKAFTMVKNNKGMLYQINTLGGKINRPPTDSAYPHRDVNYLGEVQYYWDKASGEDHALAQMKTIQAMIKQGGVNAHYANYCDINIDSFEKAYYASALPRLKQLKAKLDPGNRFNYPQSIKPA